jgi:phage shock protein A
MSERETRKSYETVSKALDRALAKQIKLMAQIKSLKLRKRQLELGYDELKGMTSKWKHRAEVAEHDLRKKLWKVLLERKE